MSAPKWQAGKLYFPGDLAQPITAPSLVPIQVDNGDFSAGPSGWDFGGKSIYHADGYGGANGSVVNPPGSGSGEALNQTHLLVAPGDPVTLRCMIHQGASKRGQAGGWVFMRWFDSIGAQLGEDVKGNEVIDGSGGAWHPSTLTTTAPANAAYGRAGIGLRQYVAASPCNGDNLTVSGAFAPAPAGLIYKAVQPASGMSGSSEPAWPPTLGLQVTDNEVIWEAVSTNRVTWTASPLYVSGATEPDWPTAAGGFVLDGTAEWEAVSRRVEDKNCPNTKIVVIVASKVYAADGDIVRYSATVNPLDWTTPEDAGYLPYGLQQYGANPIAAMSIYRSNLVIFNAQAFQMWQVDEDPANSALLDALPIGSTFHKALSPVSNDLFFLSQQGVRSMGIAAGSTNLAAGDVGMPIDPLVQLAISVDAKAVSTYYPGAGQYWLAIASGQAPPPVGDA